MKTPFRSILGAALIVLLAAAGACRAKRAGEDSGPAGEHDDHGPEAANSVTLSADAVAAVEFRAETATVRSMARSVAAVGELEWNARRLVHLTARTSGRLERALVVRGDRVRAGQLLAEIYSPDFLTLRAEYLQAAARAERLAGDPEEGAAARAVLGGARERLTLLGLTVAEDERLDPTNAAQPLLPVRAPLAGTVIESGVVSGDAVEIGSSLFRIADPAVLWARLQFRERDLDGLKPGAEAVLRTQAYPGEAFGGRLVLVGDVVDAATRTVEGRVEVANPGGRLKAGMFVEASVPADGERRALVVPEAAVQDDGGRPVLFIRTGDGTFVRREVALGEAVAGAVEITAGLAEGESVVVSGGFLLLSELRKGSLEDEHGHR